MPRETGEHKEMKVTRNYDVTCRKWYESWSTDGNTNNIQLMANPQLQQLQGDKKEKRY